MIFTGSVVGLSIIGAIVYLALPSSQRQLDLGGQADLPPFAEAAPVVASLAPATPSVADLADGTWVLTASQRTGIPARALKAYAGVAIKLHIINPTCGIGWNTLAGIGEIESHHGTIFGGRVTANGTVVPPIFGVELDGVDVAKVPGAPSGAASGAASAAASGAPTPNASPSFDRAAGPMQLISQTWRNWHTDANADGVEDVQNIDDATMASANYLCRAGKHLGTESGWRTAILAYNRSERYRIDVLRSAVGYASDALTPR